MNIVVIGPPAAGRSTQSTALASVQHAACISTGDLLRREIAIGSLLGRSIARDVAVGDHVADAITTELLRARIKQIPPGTGLVLDGYPRTEAQTRVLDAMLADRGSVVDLVVMLEVDDATAADRVAQAGTGVDDPTFQHRVVVARAQLDVVAAVYEARGVLHRLDGTASREQVADAMSALIADIAVAA